ncbi:MAG: hypothetical protein GY754_24685 [bacterium]|nr:hypothetical protein [bacterium]
MKQINNNLAIDLQEEIGLKNDPLSEIVETIKKDAEKDPSGYLENAIVPEGGE